MGCSTLKKFPYERPAVFFHSARLFVPLFLRGTSASFEENNMKLRMKKQVKLRLCVLFMARLFWSVILSILPYGLAIHCEHNLIFVNILMFFLKEFQEMHQETKPITFRVSLQLYQAIERVLEAGLYVNESDLFREALREKLKKINMNRDSRCS